MKFPQNSHIKKHKSVLNLQTKIHFFKKNSFLFCLNLKLNNNTILGATRVSNHRIHLKIPPFYIIYIFGGII